MSNVAAGRRLDVVHTHTQKVKGKTDAEVTWEIRERSSLDDVLPVQGFQNLGTAEPLEAALHVVVIPFKWLRPKNPADEKKETE